MWMNDNSKTKEQLIAELVELRKKLEHYEHGPIAAPLLLDSVVENLPLMIFVKEAKTLDFVLFNKAGEDLLGYSRADLIGKNDYDFFPEDEAKRFIANDRQVLDNKQLLDISEETIQTVKGERILHTRKIPILDSQDKPVYLLGISVDITEQKNAQQALFLAKKQAESANRAKSDFLASLSHELRTPLNSILGFAQLLQMGRVNPLNPSQLTNVSQIIDGGTHLLKLINDVLDLASIEAGKTDFNIEEVPVKAVVDDCMDYVRANAALGNILLSTAFECNNRFVVGDETRIKQVLLNLLSNGIKYNQTGGSVTVACTKIGSTTLRISVTDTGKGIAEDMRAQMFLPFNRLGAELTDIDGTGLGLVVCKNLIEQMQGKIGFEAHNTGSTFWFELPLGEKTLNNTSTVKTTKPLKSQYKLNALVLYVEDNLSNIQLMEAICKNVEGMRLKTVTTAEKGIAIAQALQPDIIILDIDLPGMCGIEAAEYLRKSLRTANIPIVGLSARAMPADIDSALDAGFEQYLTKPINVGKLMETLTDLM